MDDMDSFFKRVDQVYDILKMAKERKMKTATEDEESLFAIEEENSYDIPFVKVKRAVCESIFFNVPPAPPESGGILGIKNGVICAFVPDNSKQESERATYSPNIQFLNKCIEKWTDEGIEFCGIIHSHPSKQTTLSATDMEYIEEMYLNNPSLGITYFPLFIDGRDMIVYSVKKRNGQICTRRIQPKIVD